MREKEKKPTQKNKAIRATDALTAETIRTLCRENTFPKRSRWLIAQPIADLINGFHSHVMIANEIKVETYGLMVERYEHQTIALAYLEAANIKMGLALTVLDLDADKLEKWAHKFNETRREVMGWRAGDRRRYEKRFGPISQESIRETDEFDYAVRSPNPSNANNPRNVNPSGALNNNNANNSNGVPADRENVRSSKPEGRTQSTHTGVRTSWPAKPAKTSRAPKAKTAPCDADTSGELL